jgi:DNA-binding CsgD family transcriptional regulator
MADETRQPPGAHDATLVGREREQAVLRDALDAALAGHGSLVLIGGEAGVGKTALAEATLAAAGHRGALVLVGRCYDLAETPPHGPWAEILGRAPRGDALPAPPALAGEGATSQAALFASVQVYLAALAAHQPLVLLLDDLHWADPASLDLLRVIGRSLAGLPLLMLVTYRADELTSRHPLYTLLPLYEREARARRLDLRRFDAAGVRDLVMTRYALPDEAEAQLATWLHRRAEGNAFFTIQLLRALEEERILDATPAGWALGDLDAVGLPAPLRQVLDGRLARLDTTTRRLLAVAAVIGQDVPLNLWAATAEIGEEQLLAAIETAVEAHLVAETAGGQAVHFAHALIREALYAGLLAARRRVHRRVAELLASERTPDADAVAFHFRQAGDDRAIDWLVTAGRRAAHAYAFVTAVRRYETALALLDAGGAADTQRDWLAYQLATMFLYLDPIRGIATLDAVVASAAAAGDRTLEALARFQRGLTHNLGGHSLAGLDDMLPSLRILEALPPTEVGRIRSCLGPHYHIDGDRAAVARQLAFAMRHAEARPLAEYLVADPGKRRTYPYGSGAWALGLLAATQGQPDIACRWFVEGHEGFHASGIHMGGLNFTLQELEVVHLAYNPDRPEDGERLLETSHRLEALASASGVTGMPTAASLPLLLLHGEWAQAEKRARSLLSVSYFLARAAGERCLAFLALYRGESGRVARYVARVLPQGPDTEPGRLRFHYANEGQRLAAASALDAGDLPAAHAWLTAHDRWLDWSAAILGRSEGHALWARYHRLARDFPAAGAHAEAARGHASAPRQPLALLAAYRLLGELATAARAQADARAHLHAALALADACAAPYDRALTLLALTELHASTGDDARARDALAEARRILEPLNARPALARAGAALTALAAQSIPPAPSPAGLSARETEVLRLVAAGLSNAEIAEHLSLSIRTVEQHLRSVYNKTGARSRTAATRFALEHGLR